MSVKVRCTGCKKVLNVPDAARGKGIKCPHCETKLRIPAKARKPKPAVAKKKSLEESGFFASLDLSTMEDANVRLCPKCGLELDLETTECPECGIDIETGQLGETELARRSRKGPDPKIFYETARSDARKFRSENMGIVFRVFAIFVICSLLGGGAAFMTWWVERMPPKVFWGFVSFIIIMVPPGWTWFLHTEIIRGTLEERTNFKRIPGDFFRNTALGIKLFLWLLVFSLQFQLVAGVIGGPCWFLDMPYGSYAAAGLACLLVVLMFPIAMTHMAMPVTYRGWLAHNVWLTFWRNRGPTLYWCLLLFVSMIPTMAVVGGIAGVFLWDPGESGPGVVEFVVAGVLWMVFCFTFSFAAVLNMRTNGRFAFCFKSNLDLITFEKEAKYVPKPVGDEFDEQGPKTPPGKAVAALLLFFLVMGLVGGGIYGTFSPILGFFAGMPIGLGWAGCVVSFIGGVMVLTAAFNEGPLWGIGCILFWPLEIAFIIMNWQETKWGLLLQLAGTFYVIVACFLGFGPILMKLYGL